MARPVIGFLTDFGSDSAAAICRGVMLSIAPDAQIVDIDHGVRKFAVGDGAFLLWAALPWLPVGAHVGVVDPGVGTERRPIALRVSRGDLLVGPDNGLLRPAAERLGGVVEARLLENADLMLPERSSTFHGRDVFAPMTAHLAAGVPFDAVGRLVATDSLVGHAFPAAQAEPGGALVLEVLYVDSFGNVRLSGRPADLGSDAGSGTPRFDVQPLRAEPAAAAPAGPATSASAGRPVPLVRTFGEVAPGDLLIYRDSNGCLAIGINQGSAAAALGLSAGDRVRIGPA